MQTQTTTATTASHTLRPALFLGLALASFGQATASAQTSDSWRYFRVGNTGLQGDYCEALWIGPDGDPWIAGYEPNFEEGGLSKFIQAENRWENVSNVDYPVLGHPDDQGKIRIRDIVEENSGKLWLGTWVGAVRFDPAVGPSSIQRFGPGNSALVNDFVWDMDTAPDGTGWFSNAGIVRHNPQSGSWTRYPFGLQYVAVQPKATGGYYVWSTDTAGFLSPVHRFDSTTGQWTVFPASDQPGAVQALPGLDAVDATGNLWALRGTGPGGYPSLDYLKPDGTWVAPPEPSAAFGFSGSAFKAYGDRQALLADGGGFVWRFNGTAWQNLGQWAATQFTAELDVDAAGNIWVCGSGGAARRDAVSGQWQRYRITNTGDCDNFPLDLALDPARGLVYANANATAGVGGMTRFDGQRWTSWNQLTYGLGYDWPFLTDNGRAFQPRSSNGNVIVAPSDWIYGVHEWNGSSFQQLPGLDGALEMCEDSLGRIWAAGNFAGLHRWTGSQWVLVPFGSNATEILPDPKFPGVVWASSSGEVVRTDGVTTQSWTSTDFPGSAGTFRGLTVGTDGKAWIGTWQQFTQSLSTLVHLDPITNTHSQLLHDQGWPFPGEHVSPLAVTPDGRLWLLYDSEYPSAESGLCWWDGNQVGQYPAPNGGVPQWGGLPHAAILDCEWWSVPGGYELWLACASRGIAALRIETPGSVTALGCDLNPAGSLVASSYPALGQALVLSVDNPLGTQAAGSLPLLALGTAAYLSPCGLPLPGLHMDAISAGEWLVALPWFLDLVGMPWQGPGQAVPFNLMVPVNPGLLGLEIFAQGALLNAGPSGPLLALTRGLRLQVGL